MLRFLPRVHGYRTRRLSLRHKKPWFSPAAKHLSVRRRVLVSLSPGPFPTLNLSSTANVNATAASVHTVMMTNRFLFLSTSPHGWMGEWMQGYAPVTPRRPTPHQTQQDGTKKLRYTPKGQVISRFGASLVHGLTTFQVVLRIWQEGVGGGGSPSDGYPALSPTPPLFDQNVLAHDNRSFIEGWMDGSNHSHRKDRHQTTRSNITSEWLGCGRR